MRADFVRPGELQSVLTTHRRARTRAIQRWSPRRTRRWRSGEKRVGNPHGIPFLWCRALGDTTRRRGANQRQLVDSCRQGLRAYRGGNRACSGTRSSKILRILICLSAMFRVNQSVLPVGVLVMVPARGAQSPGFDSEQVALLFTRLRAGCPFIHARAIIRRCLDLAYPVMFSARSAPLMAQTPSTAALSICCQSVWQQ
jgi:hypothetical protein